MRILLLGVVAVGMVFGQTPSSKRRVIVLTDIENEPDDTQSMVRFLVYSNQWDVEALIATTSVHQRDRTASAKIRELVSAYGQVRGNLLKHEPGFPTGLPALILKARPNLLHGHPRQEAVTPRGYFDTLRVCRPGNHRTSCAC